MGYFLSTCTGGCSRRPLSLVSIVTVFLLLFVIGSVGWIEVLNARAGGVLPRLAVNGKQSKWRTAARAAVRKSSMSGMSEIEVERETQVKDAVISVGLSQYVACPVCILLGVIILCDGVWSSVRSRAFIGVIGVASGVASFCVVWHRQYWNSLGW